MSAFNELNARTERLLPMLRRMVRRGNVTGLQKLLKRERAEDIAASMHHLTWSEQRALYRAVEDRDSAADLLAFLPESSVREVAREITEEVMGDILEGCCAAESSVEERADRDREVLGSLSDYGVRRGEQLVIAKDRVRTGFQPLGRPEAPPLVGPVERID